MAYEALNNLGPCRARVVIVVLNDNGRSLRADGHAPVGGLRSPAARTAADAARVLRGARRPLRRPGRRPRHRGDSSRRCGPRRELDGAVRRARAHAEGSGLPAGRGRRREAPARRRPVRPVDSGELRSPSPARTPTRSPRRCSRRPSSTPNWWRSPRRCRAPTGLLPFAERFPDRFFDVGIAEQHAVTAAAGMAMGGLRPVVAIYSTFLNRAWDQVVHDVGLHRLPVVFCLDRAGITGDDGPSHHGVLRHGAAHQGPGHDRVRAVVVRRGGRHAARRPADHRGPGRAPLAEDARRRRRRGRHRDASHDGCSRGATCASSRSARWSRRRARPPRSSPSTPSARRSGTCGRCRSTSACSRRRPASRSSSPWRTASPKAASGR